MGDKTFSAGMPDSEGTGGHGRVGLGLENSETHLSPCNLLSFETVPRDVSSVEVWIRNLDCVCPAHPNSGGAGFCHEGRTCQDSKAAHGIKRTQLEACHSEVGEVGSQWSQIRQRAAPESVMRRVSPEA